MPSVEGLDYETFGEVNLPKRGLDNYVNGAGFTPLIASMDSDTLGSETFDFIRYPEHARAKFMERIWSARSWGVPLSAHNLGFERAVMEFMGLEPLDYSNAIDSAVVARMMGAASHLEAAAPQLTDIRKLEVGKELIQLFSIPNERNGGRPFTWDEISADSELEAKWRLFAEYCEMDAKASRTIVETYRGPAMDREQQNEWLTYRMNQVGWNVDLVKVREMQRRYEDNSAQLISDFTVRHDIQSTTFLNSTPQMQAWCEVRGIKTSSFDAEHVTRLKKRINNALAKMNPTDPRYEGYNDVLDLLIIKEDLGGSSLKKLQVILDLVSDDGRLRNQYMHLGAGQTYRTTGKGVQMQNLKRLSSNLLDMEDLDDPDNEIDNTTLAENLRQVFTATHEDGRLIVGDFSSVESRGLAWVAGADWKIDAYRAGKDLYKVQASTIYGKDYDSITKDERQTGKLGELSCGYGAGPSAVTRFAGKMGIDMTEEQALDMIVRPWRASNPETVELWETLNSALHQFVTQGRTVPVSLAHGLSLGLRPVETPQSLHAQHPGAQSMTMRLYSRSNDGRDDWVMDRMFHGLYMRGNDVCFYKPSDRKTGDLWKNHYRDPKTGKIVFYKLYGGKLAGILVQSMCRELFFDSLQQLHKTLAAVPNVDIVGQFHDEIVLDWAPGASGHGMSLEDTKKVMEVAMSTVRPSFKGFPLQAEIQDDFRYTK